MKCIYERPQQKVLCGSLLTVIATSWNDGYGGHGVIEGNPNHDQEVRVKGRGWETIDRGWDVFGE